MEEEASTIYQPDCSCYKNKELSVLVYRLFQLQNGVSVQSSWGGGGGGGSVGLKIVHIYFGMIGVLFPRIHSGPQST
jgi:hypothetical protein